MATEQPKQEKWVTYQEAEKLGKLIGRQFVKKDDDKWAKKFFYKVESAIPYSPADPLADPEKFRMNFLIQKYHRNKTKKVDVATESGTRERIERNDIVEGHQLINGNWRCVDDEASRLIDSEKFKAEFEPDNVAE